MRSLQHWIGTMLVLADMLSRPKDERGLSQSTENAILLAGAVTVAGIVVTLITAYVRTRIPT